MSIINTIYPLKEVLRNRSHEVEELAKDAIEANPFYLPGFLLPWVEFFGDGHEQCLVWEDSSRRMHGMLPLMSDRRSPVPGVCFIDALKNEYLYQTVPLVRRGSEAKVVTSLAQVRKGSLRTVIGRKVLGIRILESGIDSPFFVELSTARMFDGVKGVTIFPTDRAVLRPGYSYEEHLTRTISKKHRKDAARKRSKLESELGGVLQFEVTIAPQEERIEEFLALEASGWKGRCGSAIKELPQVKAFFKAMSARMCNLCELHTLSVAGRPIAMMHVLRSGDAYFAYRLGVDERVHTHSPGALLLMEITRRMLDECKFSLFDSCATSSSELFRRQWSETRHLATCYMNLGSFVGGLVIEGMRVARAAHRLAKKVNVMQFDKSKECS